METNVLNPAVQDEQVGLCADATCESCPVDETQETSTLDLSDKSKPELIEMLRSAIDTKAVSDIREETEAIKIAFYKRHKQEVELSRKEFIEQGGDAEAFTVEPDEYEPQLKELLATYREKRNALTHEVEKEQMENYQAKLALIDELKELIGKNEIASDTFNHFRSIQHRWKEIGNVPKSYMNDLWNSYHLHVENFYNFVKINNELRDLDLKKNLEAKTLLCEQAEALILQPDVIEAFKQLQELHASWREIGPVAMEQKEALWNRFRNASGIINKRYQEHFDAIKEEQLSNLNLKKELCQKVEEINASTIDSRKEWEEKTKEIIEIQKIWRTIGFAPKKENTTIFERFRSACNLFFEKKQEFYSGQKESFSHNIEAKEALCQKAEELAGSQDWAKTTNELIELQKEWKKVGAMPKKESDILWKRFRTACDRFFEEKSKHFAAIDDKFNENLKAKEAIIVELSAFEESDPEEALNKLKEIQRRWAAAGFVPIKEKKQIENRYKELIDGLFAKFKNSAKGIKFDKYKERVSSMKENGSRHLSQEREKILSKIKALESDITLWDNNIGFFANSKNAQAMIKEVENKIAKAKENIVSLKEKLKILNNQ